MVNTLCYKYYSSKINVLYSRESIKEDDDGLVNYSILDLVQKNKRKRQADKIGKNRLGMMRHFFIIVDCSEAMSVQDLKPTRLLCSVKLLEMFIEEYFDENPISQIGVIAMKNKRAEKITELSGSSKEHVKHLNNLTKLNLVGEPSLQNGLELAMESLKMVPAHASREVLVIIGNLTICDPSDINNTISLLKNDGIRCSVISLSAETRIFKHLASETGGNFSTILDDCHFKDQLFAHIDPPLAVSQEFSLIKMGFPNGDVDNEKNPALSMCMCHIEGTDKPKLSVGGYRCPQCLSKYCELPTECSACGLTLVSAPHLARSYHHLFPVAQFLELTFEKQHDICYACQKVFDDTDKTVEEIILYMFVIDSIPKTIYFLFLDLSMRKL